MVLANLIRKAELNGMMGQVIHPSIAVAPCPPGCVLVRLESGREIAVKPKNLQHINSWAFAAHQKKLKMYKKLILSGLSAHMHVIIYMSACTHLVVRHLDLHLSTYIGKLVSV